MNILAIDTTTKKANVSLMYENKIYSKSIDNEITHSEKFLPLVDSLLKETNTSLSDIDLFASTTGPGSFTGIRIGLASIKAFAKVYNKKIFSLTSLEVMAYSAINDNYNYIVSLMDAKNSRVYYTIYEISYEHNIPKLTNVIPYFNDEITVANEKINNFFKNITDTNICITGDTAKSYENNIIIKNNTTTFKNTTLDSNNIILVVQNEFNILGDDFKNSPYLTDYISLDATYIRCSEAERTKYGENK